jgi:hypothetical protein
MLIIHVTTRYEQMKEHIPTCERGCDCECADPIIEQYSHLENVNCILVLCEKGRMGACGISLVTLYRQTNQNESAP